MKKSLLIMGVALISLSACAEKTNNAIETSTVEDPETLKIYTTIFPLADWTKRIGGEFVEVEAMIPAGADAHTYELTAQQMVAVADADAFIYNGAGLEGFAEKIIEAVSSHDVEVVAAIEGIDLLAATHDHHDHHDHDEETDAHTDHDDQDPHVWLDPILAMDMAKNIKEKLIMLMPEQENVFKKNYEQLVIDFQTLDQSFTQLMENAKQDTMMVSHAGYGYWEERYGIKQLGIAGISSTSEPSQRELEQTVRMAKERDLSYVLFEPNISDQVTEVVRKELELESLPIYNLEGLTPEQEKAGEDYFSLMKQNIHTLRQVLGSD
ncbi:zinc ABC transporter substrate-binding protein [Bacillus sp. FSL W7-1360]